MKELSTAGKGALWTYDDPGWSAGIMMGGLLASGLSLLGVPWAVPSMLALLLSDACRRWDDDWRNEIVGDA
jgi:hypothetical protein